MNINVKKAPETDWVPGGKTGCHTSRSDIPSDL